MNVGRLTERYANYFQADGGCDIGHIPLAYRLVLIAETCTKSQLAPFNPASQTIQAQDYAPYAVNVHQLTDFWHTLLFHPHIQGIMA